MLGASVFAVSESNDAEQAVGVLGLELFERGDCGDDCIVHESGASGIGFGNESVEVVDGLSEAALVLNNMIKEEEGDHVLQIVGDGPVGESLEERFHGSDSLEIGLVEETGAHGA